MTTFRSAIAILLATAAGTVAEPGMGNLIEWQRGFGGNGREELSILQRTPDDGFIIAINSSSPPSGNKTSAHYGEQDFWLIRTDSAGREIWQSAFGGSGGDTVLLLLQAEDGGYLMGGTSSSPISGNKDSPHHASGWETDYWIVKVNAQGEKEWDRSFGGSGTETLMDVQITPDGGYLLTGNSRSPVSGVRTVPQSGIYDVWVVKLDAGGLKQWEKSFGQLEYSYVQQVYRRGGEGFVLAGYTSIDMYFTGAKFWVVSIDSEGETLWESTLGGGTWDKLDSFVPTADGGYLLAGNTRSYATGRLNGVNMNDEDFWVVKIDSGGEREWDRAFGGNQIEQMRAVVPALDGGFLLAGYSSSSNSGNKQAPGFGESDYWVVKIGADGVKEWDRSFGGSDYEYLQVAKRRDDGGFLIGGNSLSFPSGNKESARFGDSYPDGWIVALDASGGKEWDRSLGGNGVELVVEMVMDRANGAIVALTSGSGISGNKTEIGYGGSDFWMVKLGEFAAPVVVSHPENRVVPPGATVTLRVSATGTAPLTYQWMKDGVELDGEISDTLIIEDFQAANEGDYTVAVTNSIGTAISNAAILSLTVPLGEALDAPELRWATSGGSSWFGQKEISFDGESAARSGVVGDGGESWIETTVEGPGVVSFWWRVSAAIPLAELVFSVNGERREGIWDDFGWWLERHSLPAGTHTLRWSYLPIGAVSGAEGSGWLDRVTFAFGDGASMTVSDSVGDEFDRRLPFGKLNGSEPVTETVSIRNTDSQNDLVIDRISLRVLSARNAGYGTSGNAKEPSDLSTASSYDEDLPPPYPHVDWDRAHDPSTILVRFKEKSDAAQRLSVHSETGARMVRRMDRIPLDVVEIPKGGDLRRIVEEYQSDPAVVYAEPNYVVTPSDFRPDPLFSELWALNNSGRDGGTLGSDIGALRAWQLTKGSEEIIVAVIDTGVDYTHPDLAGNMWVNPSPSFGDVHGASWTSGNGSVTDGDPMDSDDHGTHVAGTIGASAGNDLGVAGVSPRVRIMALKFMKPGENGTSGSTADAIAALEYAVAHGAHLSNNSWGGDTYSYALYDAISQAAHANHLFIAAAGNEGRYSDTVPEFPAAYPLPNIVSVANSDRNDRLRASSNYGSATVHLAAPGSEILSTAPDGSYSRKTGTSMAAPHVAGAAALLFSIKPEADYRQVRKAILDGVTPVPALEGFVGSGGRLNAYGALRKFHESLEFALRDTPNFPMVLAPGESLDFEIVYQPTIPGIHEATLFIESQALSEPIVEVALSGQFGLTLAEALGTPDWIWDTGGDAPWTSRAEEDEGFPKASSGKILHHQESWLKTSVEGPGRLHFWWAVSSEDRFDWLEFRVNGDVQARISGEVDWHERRHDLGEGTNLVEWRYAKDVNSTFGADQGWLARVQFVSSRPAFVEWADRLDLPLGGRGALHRYGPLRMTNLAAFAMGLDPRTATRDDLPQLKGSAVENRIDFHYRRSTTAEGVALIFEAGDDLTSWRQMMPVEDWLREEVDGVQFRTARFATDNTERLFFRLRFLFLTNPPSPASSKVN